ncbi:hypothetical protein [Allosphingosinicella vermicomposti]|uniref:hypothetical protein n=1 Tax=Allosphingosinicella vermicomposti TaxID=614671 RepID=UPI000D102744|nr:hypothetical protein [Allosphingosinicella vermicomposti]
MVQFLSALFFLLAFAGAAAIIQMTVRDYRDEILAALLGEVPPRRAGRSWSRTRLNARPRPVVISVRQQRAAA